MMDTKFIESEGQLIPLLRCKSYEFSFPVGVTVSHDSRVYVCAMSDTLEILEADGSMSELPLCPKHKEKSGVEFQREDSPFEQIECVQASSDGGVVVCDEVNNLRKYNRDGELLWKIEAEISSNTAVSRFCIGINDWLYCPADHQVNVYLPNGVFSHVLVKDLECVKGIAVDGNNNVHISVSSSIQVFNTEGKQICEYGHPKLKEASAIAISNGDPQLVVATEYDTEKLFIFDIMGSFLYSVKGVRCICDVTFGPDNSLWVAQWEAHHFSEVICIPELFQLPPPLSYLCELSILPHLNELPVSRLPPRLARLFEKWTKLLTVAVKYSSFTDDRSKSRSVLETFKLKVEPDVSDDMVLWLVCRRMNLKYSEFDIASHNSSRSLKRWKRVPFPSECEDVDFFAFHE